jgi:hypothetical protein
MWTTLRNLAVLLNRLGDHDHAVFLTSAADQAPEAPGVSEAAWWTQKSADSATSRRDAAWVPATMASRAEVLGTARRAIDDARARCS